MVRDLWGPPDIQDRRHSSYSMQPILRGDAASVYGVDLLEESAINEICCVHVLRILLKKADDEIGELEKYLLSLRSELKWAENEEWSDLCSSALEEKIDYLNISLKRLRNAKQEDDKSCSSMPGEPAEDMYEILKTMLAGGYRKKDQPTNQLNAFTTCKSELEAKDDAGDGSCSDALNTEGASDTSLKPPGKEGIPDSNEHIAVSIELNIPCGLHHSCNPNGLKERSDDALCDDQCDHVGLEPLSSYFPPLVSLKDGRKASKVAVNSVLGSTGSSPNSKVKTEVSQCGSPAICSFVELQHQRVEGASKVEEKSNQVMPNDEAVVSKRSTIIPYKMPQRPNRKRKTRSVITSPRKVRLPSADNSKGFFYQKEKEQLMYRIEAEKASLRKPLSGNILKEAVLSVQSRPRQQKSFTPGDSVLKKVPTLSSSAETTDASIEIQFSNSDGESMGSGPNSSSVLTCREEIDESRSDRGRLSSQAKLNLEDLKLIDLRAIAKQKNLKKYHKLRKNVLVEQIANSLRGS